MVLLHEGRNLIVPNCSVLLESIGALESDAPCVFEEDGASLERAASFEAIAVDYAPRIPGRIVLERSTKVRRIALLEKDGASADLGRKILESVAFQILLVDVVAEDGTTVVHYSLFQGYARLPRIGERVAADVDFIQVFHVQERFRLV